MKRNLFKKLMQLKFVVVEREKVDAEGVNTKDMMKRIRRLEFKGIRQ